MAFNSVNAAVRGVSEIEAARRGIAAQLAATLRANDGSETAESIALAKIMDALHDIWREVPAEYRG